MSAIIVEEKNKKDLKKKLVFLILRHLESSAGFQENQRIKITNLTHPDIKIVTKNPEKASIGIDGIKEIKKFVSFYPYELPYKVILIPNANEMTPEAQNALLKTLEDHSTTTFFILGTNSRKNLLPTVLSRCSLATIHPNDLEAFDYTDNTKGSETTSENFSLNNLSFSQIDKIFAEKDINKKAKTLELIQNTIEEERIALRQAVIEQKKRSSAQSLSRIELLQKLQKMAEANTNPKLVAERYLVETTVE